MARPTKYRAEYAEQALKLCRLGATDVELADFFEVSPATIDNWKRDHKEFLGSIKRGKEFSDAEVADRLFKRATGYSHPEVDIRVIDNEIVQTPLIKHYAPDTAAAIFWLKNRQRGKWRDKVEVDNTSSDGSMSPVTPTMTEEQLDRLAKKINDEV